MQNIFHENLLDEKGKLWLWLMVAKQCPLVLVYSGIQKLACQTMSTCSRVFWHTKVGIKLPTDQSIANNACTLSYF